MPPLPLAKENTMVKLNRSQKGKTSFSSRSMPRCQVALLLAVVLLFVALPMHPGAYARTKRGLNGWQGEQSLSSLMGLLLEADSLVKTEMVRSELKQVREAVGHASEGNLNSTPSASEIWDPSGTRVVREKLRHIIDDPRGESTEFQEKIANALKLVEDNMAIGVDSGMPVRTETASGLSTTTFDTLQGTVSVSLPDDVRAGDTISGTVISEPKGNTKDEQAKNQDSLNGYVVEVAKQETPAQQQGSKWSIPSTAQFIPVVLKDKQGKVVGRTEVPFIEMKYVKPNADNKLNGDLPKAVDYLLPPFGQAGRPVSVSGPFEGDFNNTKIKVGDQTAQFLAESPRKVVVRSPANVTGPATMEVNEKGKVVARSNYQSISVRLSAEKLNLIRGEQTILTATLSGLNGVTGPVSFQLTNATPWTVRMEGGESQNVIASPEYFTGGVFTAKRTLTGVKAGGFSINAVVEPAESAPRDSAVWKTSPGTHWSPTDGGLISGNLNGSPDKAGDAKKIFGGPPPKFDSNGKPIRNDGPGSPVLPLHEMFRVTLNGFKVNHQTYQGLLAAWDSVTFYPSVGTVDAAGQIRWSIWGGATTTIGASPPTRVRGGSASGTGGLRTNDGFPTQDSPWRRTVPNGAAPGTIPPTVYFERELVQNTTAVVIIPTIWVVAGPDDLGLHNSYLAQVNHDRSALGRAVANIIRGPQPLALNSYLRSGASMGLNNTMRLAIGVPQERPIGMQPERDQFGFIPQVLVLTYDSAEFMSRTDFGFGIGVVPVRYVDPQGFAGDYTLYFQVERVRTEA
jgi:hypothetical protein